MDPATYASLILDRDPPPVQVDDGAPAAATLTVLTLTSDLSPHQAAAAAVAGVDLPGLAEQARFTAKAGSTLTLQVTPKTVAVGVGDGSVGAWRRAGAAVAAAGARGAVVDLQFPEDTPADQVAALVEGLLLGAYSPIALGRTERPAPVARVRLPAGTDPAAVERGRLAASTGWLSRDLAGTPSSIKNPPWLADLAGQLAARHGLQAEVLGPDELAAGGFGCLLAVGAASPTPPRLVVLRHRPDQLLPGSRHIVLVGKGITFDTGGLNLKPGEAMAPMRTDMTGAAATLAAVVGAARAQLPLQITAVLALAENAIGGAAYRPGDVLRAHDGTTVEIGNTDAEGRLALADALAWAGATLEPDVLVDLATLTGAATLGLGRQHAAMFSADEDLAVEFESAGQACGERVWRMPLVEDYAPALDSEVADVNHIATTGRFGGGGAITAALFLRRFTTAAPWVHLDIAGPARSDKAAHEIPKGPTGYGARLLLRWLLDEAGQSR